jgi:hypothetical protein
MSPLELAAAVKASAPLNMVIRNGPQNARRSEKAVWISILNEAQSASKTRATFAPIASLTQNPQPIHFRARSSMLSLGFI